MHNRIYQISAAPVPKKAYISESDYCGQWFVDVIADYVSGDNNREEDIQSLSRMLSEQKVAQFGAGPDGETDSFVLLPNGKEAYFAGAYEAFAEARETILKMGPAEFVSESPLGEALQRLRHAYCQSFDCCYVAFGKTEDPDTIPLDEFIRRAETGTRYYIGGVLDYHY